MSDIDNPIPKGNFLTGKLGPMPVWAWGAILGVGVLGFYLLRNRGAVPTADTTTDGSALDTVDDPFTGPTTGNSNAAPTVPGSVSGSPTDNQSWLNQAISGTANALSASPSAVSSVLSRYLYDGGTFTATEQKYIDKAISLYGAPPQGTGGSSTFVPNPPTTPAKPAGSVPVKGQYQLMTVKKSGGQSVIRLVNNVTKKQTWVKTSADVRGLSAWINSINSGKSGVSVGSTNINAYRGLVD